MSIKTTDRIWKNMQKQIETRKHSSRMRTARLQPYVFRWPPLIVDIILDTRLWKHYLPKLSFAGGKHILLNGRKINVKIFAFISAGKQQESEWAGLLSVGTTLCYSSVSSAITVRIILQQNQLMNMCFRFYHEGEYKSSYFKNILSLAISDKISGRQIRNQTWVHDCPWGRGFAPLAGLARKEKRHVY